jgi:hypothetical protein
MIQNLITFIDKALKTVTAFGNKTFASSVSAAYYFLKFMKAVFDSEQMNSVVTHMKNEYTTMRGSIHNIDDLLESWDLA